MAFNRSARRDVHIYDAKDPTIMLGGLRLATGVTNANFFSMLEILLLLDNNYHLHNQDGDILVRNDDPLQPGSYYVFGSFSVNDEPVLVRTTSPSSGSRLESFRDAIRARDGKCAITGEEPIDPETWTGLEAAYVFPLAYYTHWTEQNFSHWITIQTENPINSVQNGPLRSDIHQLFDAYLISINPQDNYKIFCFAPDRKNIGGKYLDPTFLDNRARPVYQLLLWHFRQAVLINMKGAGEPIFEHDFPPGSDMMGEIWEGPKAVERIEFELFSRLSSVS